MSRYLEKLKKEGLSLIILKNKIILFSSKDNGIKPIFEAINTIGPSIFRDAIVIDKIVGKAVALVLSYLKVKEVHCVVLSINAKEILKNHQIKFSSEILIPLVMNKSGRDICPFEKEVLELEDPEEGYKRVYNKFKNK